MVSFHQETLWSNHIPLEIFCIDLVHLSPLPGWSTEALLYPFRTNTSLIEDEGFQRSNSWRKEVRNFRLHMLIFFTNTKLTECVFKLNLLAYVSTLPQCIASAFSVPQKLGTSDKCSTMFCKHCKKNRDTHSCKDILHCGGSQMFLS